MVELVAMFALHAGCAQRGAAQVSSPAAVAEMWMAPMSVRPSSACAIACTPSLPASIVDFGACGRCQQRL